MNDDHDSAVEDLSVGACEDRRPPARAIKVGVLRLGAPTTRLVEHRHKEFKDRVHYLARFYCTSSVRKSAQVCTGRCKKRIYQRKV